MPARILRGTSGAISHTFTVDEVPTNSSTPVTYTLVDANGDPLADPGIATAVGPDGEYVFTLSAQPDLTRGVATWSGTVGGSVTTEIDYVEIVSGFFFSLREGRASDASLADKVKYPTADLRAKRLEVEVECETICDRAFLPRYDRVVLDGSGTSSLLLRPSDPARSVADLRVIRSIRIAATIDGAFTPLDAGQLAAVAWTPDGTLRRTDGGVFDEGVRNVIVEYEYGLDTPPEPLVTAALTRLRSRLNMNKNGIPDRASSYTAAGGGGTYRLDMPGAWKTGIPEVDAAYARYSRRTTSGTPGRPVPASRTLEIRRGDWLSMFRQTGPGW